MTDGRIKITKEDYQEIIESNSRGFLNDALKEKHFGFDMMMGYGVYGAQAFQLGDDDYVILYSAGSSCD